MKKDANPLLSLLGMDKKVIIYRPEFRALTGSVTSAILLQQIFYRWAFNDESPFYKFKSPCEKAKEYKHGDSWTEELGFSIGEFDTALEKIAVKVKKHGDRPTDKLVWFWVDNDRKTYYDLNKELFISAISSLYCQPLKKVGVDDVARDENGKFLGENVDEVDNPVKRETLFTKIGKPYLRKTGNPIQTLYSNTKKTTEEALPPKKAASLPSENSFSPDQKENQKQALIKFLETGIKNNTLLAMCEGIDLTLPEIRQKFSDYWFGLERSFTGSTGDKNYVKNSIAKWIESEAVNFKNTKEKTEVRFDDKMEKVIEIFMCYSPRIPSKERKETAFSIARKLFKNGVTLEDMDIEMSKAQFLGLDYKDVDNFLQRWEKVVKMRPESWEQQYRISGNSKPITKYQQKHGTA